MEQKKLSYDEILNRGNHRQDKKDLELMEKCIRKISAKNIVEIGAMDGCSSLLLGQLSAELSGHLWSIDPKPKARLFVNLEETHLQENVTIIKAYSPWLEPKAIPKPIDFLLIDGDHRTRWALMDYHWFFPFVKVGGMIAFHDYNGRKGVGKWVRRAIDIILEDDSDKIKEICHDDTADRGIIIFKKIRD